MADQRDYDRDRAVPRGRPIYLDHHATTPVDPRVANVVVRAMTETFGNANSVDHSYGDEAAALVDLARREVAALVGGRSEGVEFTSGSTKAISLAIRHAIAGRRRVTEPLRVVASSVEHRAVLDCLAAAESAGEIVVNRLAVDGRARLDMDELRAACDSGADLVCIMAANNEVGTVNPVQRIAQLAVERGAATLIDATQAAGREPLCVEEWGITYLVLSAHKMYGPKGIGAVVRPGVDGSALRNSHSPVGGVGNGTPNVPAIAGFGEACRLRRIEMGGDEPRIASLRNRLEALLVSQVRDLVVNGDLSARLSHNLHVSVPGVPNDAVVARLRAYVAISTGAACMSGAQAPSHVLRAMRLSAALQEGALRIGIGKFTTDDELERAAVSIAECIEATRAAIKTHSHVVVRGPR